MAARCWGTRFCSPVPAEALSLDTDPLLFHQLHGQELSVTGGAGEGNRRGYCSWQSRYFQSTSITCCTLNPFRSSQGRDFSLRALFSSKCLKFLCSREHSLPDHPSAVYLERPAHDLGALLSPAPHTARGPHSQQSSLGTAISFLFYTVGPDTNQKRDSGQRGPLRELRQKLLPDINSRRQTDLSPNGTTYRTLGVGNGLSRACAGASSPLWPLVSNISCLKPLPKPSTAPTLPCSQ